MKAVTEFIAESGFTLMLCGMGAAVVGVVAYMFLNTPRYAATPFPALAAGLAVTGFAVYFLGRVSLAMQKKRARRKPAGDTEDGSW